MNNYQLFLKLKLGDLVKNLLLRVEKIALKQE